MRGALKTVDEGRGQGTERRSQLGFQFLDGFHAADPGVLLEE